MGRDMRAAVLEVDGKLEVGPVQIEDPRYGTSVWHDDTSRTAYQGSGSWTHSYRTKA